MVTEREIQAFDTSLREALVALYDESGKIKPVVADADVLWGSVNQNGAPREIWLDVVEKARQQGKLRTLIERALKDYSGNDPLQQLLVLVERLGSGPIATTVSQAQWTVKSLRLVDRAPQVDSLGVAIEAAIARPLIAVWCGDDLARHDMLRERINTLEPSIEGTTFQTLYKECRREIDIASSLNKACSIFIEADANDSKSLRRLIAKSDYAKHVVILAVDLVWTHETVAQIEDIVSWCEGLDNFAPNRRFLIAVSIEVSSRKTLWNFWKSRPKIVLEAHRKLASHKFSDSSILFLPPLPDIELKHLKDWRACMVEIHGERSDDALGDPKLSQIIPSDARPMKDVAMELEHILRSSSN